MTTLYESDVEQSAIDLLEKQGYSYLTLEALEPERQNLSEVVLQSRLKTAIDTLNPTIPVLIGVDQLVHRFGLHQPFFNQQIFQRLDPLLDVARAVVMMRMKRVVLAHYLRPIFRSCSTVAASAYKF